MNKEKDKNKEEKPDTALEEAECDIDEDTKNKSNVSTKQTKPTQWGTRDYRLSQRICYAPGSREGLSLTTRIIISIILIIIVFVIVWILL